MRKEDEKAEQVRIAKILVSNRAKDNPVDMIDQNKPGWSKGMTWQQLLDARRPRGW